jgi:hypothetical protein
LHECSSPKNFCSDAAAAHLWEWIRDLRSSLDLDWQVVRLGTLRWIRDSFVLKHLHELTISDFGLTIKGSITAVSGNRQSSIVNRR